MDSGDLKPDQRQRIIDRLVPTSRYLANMHGRMNQRLFPENDPVLKLTRRAQMSLLKLIAEVWGSGRK
jgi:hypothetical protein